MSNLTLRNLSPAAADKFQSMASTIQRYRNEKKEAIARMTRTVGCAATGAGLGFVEGYYNRTELVGLPIAATVGVLAAVGGYAMGGAESEHLLAVSDGAFTVASYQFMRDVGRDKAAKNNNSQQTSVAGDWGYRRYA